MTTAKPDGSPKAHPRARAFSNKKQLFEQLLAIALDLLRQLVRVLTKVNQNLLKKVFEFLEQMLLV